LFIEFIPAEAPSPNENKAAATGKPSLRQNVLGGKNFKTRQKPKVYVEYISILRIF